MNQFKEQYLVSVITETEVYTVWHNNKRYFKNYNEAMEALQYHITKLKKKDVKKGDRFVSSFETLKVKSATIEKRLITQWEVEKNINLK